MSAPVDMLAAMESCREWIDGASWEPDEGGFMLLAMLPIVGKNIQGWDWSDCTLPTVAEVRERLRR